MKYKAFTTAYDRNIFKLNKKLSYFSEYKVRESFKAVIKTYIKTNVAIRPVFASRR